MGWQESPIVKEGVPDVRPSWMTSPIAPAAGATQKPPESGFLHTLLGEGELGGAAVGNIIPNTINSGMDILNRVSGGVLKRGQVPTIPVGQAGKDLVSDVKGMLPEGNPNNADAQIQAERDRVLGKPSDTVADVVQQAGDVGGDVANILPAAGLVKGAAGLAAGATKGAPETIDDALTTVGYRNLPRQGEGSGAAKLGAKITGEQPLAQQHTLNNQAVTDTLAKHEAGVPQNSDLDYQSLAVSRAAGPGKVYSAAEAAMPDTMVHDPKLTSDLAGVGDTTSQLPKSPDVDLLKQTMLDQPTMTRDQLFNNIRQARDRAARFYASDQPDAHAIGDAYQGVANAYEDFVGRQLNNSPGAPVTLADWQAARTAFAKNYAVQGAVRGTSVNAAKLAAIQSKDPEKLTGGLRLIAEQQNRYPLSTGFGPTTFEPGGVGASGTPQGIIARHITGPLLGAGVGTLIGGPAGGMIGGASGLLGSELFQSVIRKALGGNPIKSAAMAEAATKNPDLASFFDQEVKPNQSEPLPPSPGPIVTGRQVATEEPPATRGTVVAPNPNPLDEGDLMSHLEAEPMGAPSQDGIPFHVPPESVGMGPLRSGRKITEPAPSHIIGVDGEPVETGAEPHADVADPREPSLMDLLENLKDHPAVMHQNRSLGISGSPATQLGTTGGVPEDIMTHLENNASGESSASLEAINRTRREQAQGQDRFLIDRDGKMWPIRGVDAADATAPKGSIIVQKGIGGEPYSILDRGGLPRANAHGLLNRALAGGHGLTLMDLLEGGGG